MSIKIKYLGLQPYQTTWQAMQDFTLQRDENSEDEIWVTEHPAVFTQGLNGKAAHILKNGHIPIVHTDRGGQITYHAPGQVVLYVLIDLKRRQLGVRALVSELESCTIHYLNELGIHASARKDAPGVYVDNNKIASLGLKIRKHCSYHGLALNLNMDLRPFEMINPCGLTGMKMTQLAAHLPLSLTPTIDEAGHALATLLSKRIGQKN